MFADDGKECITFQNLKAMARDCRSKYSDMQKTLDRVDQDGVIY